MHRNPTRRNVLATGLAAGAATLAMPRIGRAATEKVTYLFPAPDFLPAFGAFQLAKARGYYAAEGIDITFQVGRGGADVAKQVALNNVDLGGGIGDTAMIVRANGLKVKAMALLGGQCLYQVVSRKDANIKGVQDLKGKKVGVFTFQDSGYYSLLGALASLGIKKDEVQIQALGNAGMVQLMISGDVQAICAVPEWTAAIQAAGVGVDQYEITSIFPAMAQAVLASDETAAKRKQAVGGVVRGTLKAITDIMADPAAAARDYVKAVPQQAGKEAMAEDVFRRYAQLVYRTERPGQLGRFDPERVAKVQKFYLDNGIIAQASPVEELFTNEFLA